MRPLFVLCSCALFLFAAGCGAKKPEGLPPLHPTALTFTQGSSPLVHATVTLFPQDNDNSKWSFGGATNEQGVINIQTQGFDGAPAGNFKVVVTKTETTGAAATTESSDLGGASSAAVAPKSFYLVDKKYRSAATTDLTLEVKSGKNAQTFDLGAAVHEEIPVHKN